MKLAAASGPQSAYSLLRAAIRDENPVLVLEPRVLYSQRDDVVTGDSAIAELGKAKVVSPGEEATVVGFGSTVSTIQTALEGANFSVEVIDLQTLIPWDQEAVMNSVSKTGKLVLVEENPKSFGWGAEIAATISTELFDVLKAPVLRITAPDVPIPFAIDLEDRYLPNPVYVKSQIEEFLSTGNLPKTWWHEQKVGI